MSLVRTVTDVSGPDRRRVAEDELWPGLEMEWPFEGHQKAVGLK